MTSYDLDEIQKLAEEVVAANGRDDGLALSAAIDDYDHKVNVKTVLALIRVTKVAGELEREYENPAPDYTMRFALRNKLKSALSVFVSKQVEA